MEKMEILKLTVRSQTFGDILGGQKEYTREIRSETQEVYCEMDDEGYVVDIDGVLQPRKYDAIQFVCFRESYTCKVKSAHIELFKDDDDQLITYIENGEEYMAAQIVYELGGPLEEDDDEDMVLN